MASILKRRNPSGKIVYKVQFNDQFGKRHEIAAGPLKKHAEALLSTILEEVNAGVWGLPEKDNPTIEQFYERWIKAKEKALKPSSYASYVHTFKKHILPEFGDVCLDDIKPLDVQEFVDGLSDKQLSPATVGRVYRYLRSCLRQAQAWDVTSNNPCRKIILPRSDNGELDFLEPDEVKRLLGEARDPRRVMFALLAMSGLRVGEALGLAWKHINFEQYAIIVERAFDYWGGIQEPKTPSSRRAVPLLPSLAEILKEYKGIQERPLPDDLLFATRGGKPWDHSHVRKEFKETLERAGLKKVTLHSLRHTYASTMLASGASIKALQRALGHASATMTLNTYSHLIEENMESSVMRADALFKGMSEGKIVAFSRKR